MIDRRPICTTKLSHTRRWLSVRFLLTTNDMDEKVPHLDAAKPETIETKPEVVDGAVPARPGTDDIEIPDDQLDGVSGGAKDAF